MQFTITSKKIYAMIIFATASMIIIPIIAMNETEQLAKKIEEVSKSLQEANTQLEAVKKELALIPADANDSEEEYKKTALEVVALKSKVSDAAGAKDALNNAKDKAKIQSDYEKELLEKKKVSEIKIANEKAKMIKHFGSEKKLDKELQEYANAEKLFLAAATYYNRLYNDGYLSAKGNLERYERSLNGKHPLSAEDQQKIKNLKNEVEELAKKTAPKKIYEEKKQILGDYVTAYNEHRLNSNQHLDAIETTKKANKEVAQKEQEYQAKKKIAEQNIPLLAQAEKKHEEVAKKISMSCKKETELKRKDIELTSKIANLTQQKNSAEEKQKDQLIKAEKKRKQEEETAQKEADQRAQEERTRQSLERWQEFEREKQERKRKKQEEEKSRKLKAAEEEEREQQEKEKRRIADEERVEKEQQQEECRREEVERLIAEQQANKEKNRKEAAKENSIQQQKDVSTSSVGYTSPEQAIGAVFSEETVKKILSSHAMTQDQREECKRVIASCKKNPTVGNNGAVANTLEQLLNEFGNAKSSWSLTKKLLIFAGLPITIATGIITLIVFIKKMVEKKKLKKHKALKEKKTKARLEDAVEVDEEQ